jgi:hypothetical protein
MAAGLFYVYTEPGSVDEAEFHDWYDREHGPARLKVPGPEVLEDPRYRAAISTPWRDRVVASALRRERRVFGPSNVVAS